MLIRDAAADVEGGAASAQAAVSVKELLANRGVFIGCMIFLLQQFSGVNSVVYFSSSVFAKARAVPCTADLLPNRGRRSETLSQDCYVL